jgi:hypothetical protein
LNNGSAQSQNIQALFPKAISSANY